MKSSLYLYGNDLAAFRRDPYEEVLANKINLAKALLSTLVRVDNMEDTARMNEVNNAIKFNTALLAELGYDNQQIKQRTQQ